MVLGRPLGRWLGLAGSGDVDMPHVPTGPPFRSMAGLSRATALSHNNPNVNCSKVSVCLANSPIESDVWHPAGCGPGECFDPAVSKQLGRRGGGRGREEGGGERWVASPASTAVPSVQGVRPVLRSRDDCDYRGGETGGFDADVVHRERRRKRSLNQAVTVGHASGVLPSAVEPLVARVDRLASEFESLLALVAARLP